MSETATESTAPEGGQPAELGGPATPAGDAPLGPAGEKALAEWKQRAKDAERASRTQAARLQEIEDRDKSEVQKAGERATAAEQRAAAMAQRAAKAEVRALAASTFADPSDAAAFLDLTEYVDDTGVAYNNLTSRTDAAALIPEEVVTDMLGKAPEQSAALSLFRRIPVARAQTRIPVLSALPMAYWVTGDTGLKQTTEVNWANKFLNVEELATIMPVPDNVLADVDANIWDEAMPLLVEAFGRALDSAVFFGTNAPASFPASVLTAAAAAGNSVNEGSAATAGGFFGDIDKVYGRSRATATRSTASWRDVGPGEAAVGA
jgi:HK97 family phage major capsid protein